MYIYIYIHIYIYAPLHSFRILFPYLRAHSVTSVTPDSLGLYELLPAKLLCSWDAPGKNTGVGCHALLQGIFSTQGLNLGLLCLRPCRQILYHWATRDQTCKLGVLTAEPPGNSQSSVIMYILWRGTGTLSHCYTIMSWLLLLCFSLSSFSWLASISVHPLVLREVLGGWNLFPTNKKWGTQKRLQKRSVLGVMGYGDPQGPAWFQYVP